MKAGGSVCPMKRPQHGDAEGVWWWVRAKGAVDGHGM